jgi:hypothetical protein
METVSRPTLDRRPIERPRKAAAKRNVTAAKVRASLTNGSTLITDCDHRSAWMRRLRDLVMQHESDLAGDSNISESERRLVRRSAMLTLQLEMMEQRWAANEGEASSKQIETYQRVTGALRRLLESLGLQRRSKTIVPSVAEYIASINEAAE